MTQLTCLPHRRDPWVGRANYPEMTNLLWRSNSPTLSFMMMVICLSYTSNTNTNIFAKTPLHFYLDTSRDALNTCWHSMRLNENEHFPVQTHAALFAEPKTLFLLFVLKQNLPVISLYITAIVHSPFTIISCSDPAPST